MYVIKLNLSSFTTGGNHFGYFPELYLTYHGHGSYLFILQLFDMKSAS